MNPIIKREIDVALNAQSARFRVGKYIVISLILYLLFLGGGWNAVLSRLLLMMAAGILIHFFFRWKTSAWTKNWWLYKKKTRK